MQVPVNIEDVDILRSYLNELNATIDGITTINRSIGGTSSYSLNPKALPPSKEFLQFAEDTQKLQNEIKRLVENNLVTIVKTKALATAVTEQFSSFSESALAASWYGLSVTAGGTVAGFTVGAVDTDTTTPGTESSVFAIEADRFTIGKAYNLTPEEAQAVAESNEDYLTLYDSNGDALPAFGINYDVGSGSYKIYFNGSVSFTNVTGTEDLALVDMSNVTTIDGGKITTGTLSANRLTSTTGATTVWTGGGLVSANFNGNVNGTIGVPTAGFRLSSNAAGTSIDPSIYGAYIKGGYLEAVELTTTYYAPKSWPKVKIADNVVCNLYNNFVFSIPYNSTTTGSVTFRINCYGNQNATEGNSLSTLSTDITVNISTNAFYISDTGAVLKVTATSRVIVTRYLASGKSAGSQHDVTGSSSMVTFNLTLTASNASDYFIVSMIADTATSYATAGGVATISWYN